MNIDKQLNENLDIITGQQPDKPKKDNKNKSKPKEKPKETQKETQKDKPKEKIKEETKSKKKKSKKPIILTIVVTAVVITIIYLSVSVYFQYHFFKGSTINNIDVSFMTADEANAAFKNQSRTYYLEIKERNGKVEHISAEDVGLKLFDNFDASSYLEKQDAYKWIFNLSGTTTLIEFNDSSNSITFDESMLNSRFLSLECLDEEKMTDATPPDIKYENGVYTVGKVNPGTKLDIEKTKEFIKAAISNLSATLDLEEAGCYLVSETGTDNAYTELVNKLNKYVSSEITLTFNDELTPVVIDDTYISKWMSVDADMNIVFDMEAIEGFVADLSKEIETMGQTRHFKNSYGNEITVSGGDYGWWISEGKEAKEIVENIKSGETISRELNYLQKAATHGTEENDSDLGDTYIEINLLKQHLFCYKEGELITECDIISGTNENPTPTGIYRMRFMFTNYTFNRTYFKNTVAYWMVFYGDDVDSNIGLISCDFRNDFGGTTYLYNGTHGSIYVPMDSAKIIYTEIPNDIPVIIYKTY